MRSLLAFIVALMLSLPAAATTCVVSEFAASGTLTADRLNQRIRQIESCMNGHLGNVNLTSAEPIAVTNLQNKTAIYSQSWVMGTTGAASPADMVAGTDVVAWNVPVSSTLIGISVSVRGCTGCNVSVTLQKDSTTMVTIAGLTSTGTVTSFALSNAVTNLQNLNIDIAGTMTGVKSIDVVTYFTAQQQP